MTTKDDYEPFTAYDRAKWYIRHADLYSYTEFTEMIDQPRLSHNDEERNDE